MSPSLLSVLLHVGSIIQTLKDIEKGVQDLVTGKPSSQDLKSIVTDLASLLSSGVISMPGFTQEQMSTVIGDLLKAI